MFGFSLEPSVSFIFIRFISIYQEMIDNQLPPFKKTLVARTALGVNLEAIRGWLTYSTKT
jgi:hypothetical protein